MKDIIAFCMFVALVVAVLYKEGVIDWVSTTYNDAAHFINTELN